MSDPLHVLLVEDSASDAKLLVATLKALGRPIDAERVDSAEAMAAALARREWDVVISDWSLPSFGGRAALAQLRAAGADCPFIIVSGTIGEESAVEAMRAGAQDYVVKGQFNRLVPALERELKEHASRKARREAERGRQQAEHRFHRLFGSGVSGITVCSKDGLVLEANDTFLKLLGYDRAALERGELNWHDLTPPESMAISEAALVELADTGATRPFEKEYLHKEGHRVLVAIGLTMLEDDCVLAVITDLSGRRAAEVRALTLQEQLRQSQKMDAIGRLAGGVAHDFNNLLSVVLSYSEIIMSELPPGSPFVEDVAQIYRAGSRAADLTRQLLLFSRQQVVEPKLLDLDELLGGMHKMLGRILGEDITLTTRPTGSLHLVRIDPGSFEQVVMNLVVNARDAMPTGGQLTIETRNVVLDEGFVGSHHGAKPGPHVMLAVSDSGVGMDAATRARIFEPFFTTKSLGKGTGLGLSTVFGIVEQAGGTTWVYSEPGLGTSFKIYLPQADGVPDSAREVTVKTLEGRETILLVEDDEAVRGVARTVLDRHGYRVIEAADASEAFRLLDGPDAIDLLLTDVVMPGLSGPELVGLVREKHPKLKVLCMSGYTDDAAVRHGLIDSKLAYLQKPLTVESLTRKVREVLG